jgi:hypothetical protein
VHRVLTASLCQQQTVELLLPIDQFPKGVMAYPVSVGIMLRYMATTRMSPVLGRCSEVALPVLSVNNTICYVVFGAAMLGSAVMFAV